MDKPENPYRKGCLGWKLFEGDWEGKTLQEIAEKVDSIPESVYWRIVSIRLETGYQILYTKLPGDFRKKKKTKRDRIHRFCMRTATRNCDTCWNFDCNLLQKRKAVTWKNCSGYVPEPVEEVTDN